MVLWVACTVLRHVCATVKCKLSEFLSEHNKSPFSLCHKTTSVHQEDQKDYVGIEPKLPLKMSPAVCAVVGIASCTARMYMKVLIRAKEVITAFS